MRYPIEWKPDRPIEGPCVVELKICRPGETGEILKLVVACEGVAGFALHVEPAPYTPETVYSLTWEEHS